MSFDEIKLKKSSISNVPLCVYDKDFTFVVNNIEFKTSRIISDLISPKISQIHFTDPTFDTFSINTKSTGDFNHILHLINFENFKIPENEIQFFIEVFEYLGTESIKATSSNQETKITLENALDLIRMHEKHEAFSTDQISTEIFFLASHFFELYEQHEEEFKHLSYLTIERILRNENLRLKDEDQLLNYINDLYKSDNKFGTFYEYVSFLNVSASKISDFIEIFDISDLTNETWLSISNRLKQEINNKQENEKRYSGKESILFKKEENTDFNGIINYLMNESNNQIENEINFSCSSLSPSYYAKNCIVHDNTQSYYASSDDKNAWVCLEFKNHQIIPTDYTIGSPNNNFYIRSWNLEGSNDNSHWDCIDSQNDCNYLRGVNRIHTFNIQNENKKKYRFIRLRATGPSWSNNNYLRVNSVEFYGNLF